MRVKCPHLGLKTVANARAQGPTRDDVTCGNKAPSRAKEISMELPSAQEPLHVVIRNVVYSWSTAETGRIGAPRLIITLRGNWSKT
jgi:hypothetical protein